MSSIEIVPVETSELVNFTKSRHGHTTDETDPVAVEFNPATRRMTALCFDHSGGARPAPVGHGHVQWWPIRPMRGTDANALMERLRPIAQRVADGYLGGRLGDPARYTPDAQMAIQEAVDLCDDACKANGEFKIWRAAEWFAPMGDRSVQRRELGITPATTDDELAAIIAADESSDECDLVDGGLEYLQGLRAEAGGAAE